MATELISSSNNKRPLDDDDEEEDSSIKRLRLKEEEDKEKDYVVVLDIGGKQFKSRRCTFLRHPDTFLSTFFSHSNDSLTRSYFNKDTKEYHVFFDRDPDLFTYVMQFYRTGVLPLRKMMQEMDAQVVRAELDFWNIAMIHPHVEPQPKTELDHIREFTEGLLLAYRSQLIPPMSKKIYFHLPFSESLTQYTIFLPTNLSSSQAGILTSSNRRKILGMATYVGHLHPFLRNIYNSKKHGKYALEGNPVIPERLDAALATIAEMYDKSKWIGRIFNVVHDTCGVVNRLETDRKTELFLQCLEQRGFVGEVTTEQFTSQDSITVGFDDDRIICYDEMADVFESIRYPVNWIDTEEFPLKDAPFRKTQTPPKKEEGAGDSDTRIIDTTFFVTTLQLRF